jgi:carbon-monoxide dehydrogenase small subunit
MNRVSLTLNGEAVAREVEDRASLADFLRETMGLTGTHLGCEHGVCGACTVLVDGAPVRSCITLAAAVSGSEVRSVEGFGDDALMAVIREAFHEAHGLQCGFCTPGILIAVHDMIRRGRARDAREIREGLAGNICRCTGYQGIVRSVELARERWAGRAAAAAE